MRRLASLSLLAAAGCAQVLGLGDFKDGETSTGAGGDGGSTTTTTGTGTTSTGMTTATGMGGDATGGGGGTGGMAPQPGEVLWAHGFGDTVEQVGFDVDVTPAGEVYIVGSAPDNGTFMVGSTTVTGPAIWVAKLDTMGALQWSRSYAMSGAAWHYLYGIDANDNGAVIALYLEGSESIDFGTFPTRTGVAIARIGPDGSTQWTKSCGGGSGTNYKAQIGGDVLLDSAGNVFLGSLTNGPVNCNVSGTGSTGVVINKLDSNGGFVWSRGGNMLGYDDSVRLALDSAGNVLVAGSGNSNNFGGGVINGNFAAKLAANGNHIWSKQLAPACTAQPGAIMATDTDEILIGGDFSTACDFGGGSVAPAGTRDAFLVKLAANGNYVQSEQFGNGQASITSIIRRPSGESLIGGYFGGSLPLGADNLQAAGVSDGFIARLDASFAPTFARRLGGPGADRINAIDAAGGILGAVGQYNMAIDFGAVDISAFGDVDAMVLGILPP